MNKEKKVKYGEIYLYNFGCHEGSIQNGVRPAVVVQDNRFNKHSTTTIIAAVTSVSKKLYLPSHIVIGEECGLTRPSMVLLEQIACVNQADLGTYIGSVKDNKLLSAMRCGLKKTFGLWDYTPKGNADIRCLCTRCIQGYLHSENYIVRRLDPFSNSKEQCDKCDGKGYDYVFVPRKTKIKN